MISSSWNMGLPSYGGMGSAGSQIGYSVGSATGAAGGLITAGALTSSTVIGLPVGAALMAAGALIELAATIAGALHIGEGCGQTCVQATSVVNQAEPAFKLNVDTYENGQIDQATALHNFDVMWTAVQQACGAVPGTAGQNCVGDRQAGACKWHDSNGQCWNWDIGYRQPLLAPSKVPMQASSGASDLVSSIVGGFNPLLIGGIAVVVGLLMAGSD